MFFVPAVVTIVLALIALIRWWMLIGAVKHLADQKQAEHIDKLAQLTWAFRRRGRGRFKDDE